MVQKWLASIVTGVVLELINKFMAWIHAKRQEHKRNEKIDEDTKKQAEDLKKSKTDEEDQRAAEEILSRRE